MSQELSADSKAAMLDSLQSEIAGHTRAALLRAQKNALINLSQDPSPKNLLAYQKTKERLKDQQPEMPVAASTFQDVLTMAAERGCKLKKTKLFSDIKEGLLPRQKDGTFLAADIERYFGTLKRIGAAPDVVDEAWKRQQEKDVQEIRRIKAIADREEFSLAVKQGKYIARETVWLELAGRAAVLQSGLKTALEAHCLEVIDSCGGDVKRAAEVTRRMHEILEIYFDEYARPLEFEVEIEDPDDQA